MRIFEYLFMQRAFVVGILLAAVVPCVGMVVVCSRNRSGGCVVRFCEKFGKL